MNNCSNNGLIKYSSIDINKLSKENFFKDFLYAAYDNNLIDDILAQKINNDRLNNLQTYLTYYTKNESSSVMVETAESILMSIDYTLSIYLRQFDTVEEMIDCLKRESLKHMLEKGNKIIKLNVEYTKNLLSKVKKQSLLLIIIHILIL